MIKNKFNIQCTALLFFNILFTSAVMAQPCVLKVDGTNLYTSDNKKVVLRGVNAFTISGRDEDGFPTFKDISATGANVSRILWKAATNDGTRIMEYNQEQNTGWISWEWYNLKDFEKALI